MIDLNKLRYHQEHPLKKIFDNYDRGQIANELCIPAGVLSDILQGYEKPCPELAERIQHLADEIQKAEAAEITVN